MAWESFRTDYRAYRRAHSELKRFHNKSALTRGIIPRLKLRILYRRLKFLQRVELQLGFIQTAVEAGRDRFDEDGGAGVACTVTPKPPRRTGAPSERRARYWAAK